jgi:nitrogen regulatory protein P-II 1
MSDRNIGLLADVVLITCIVEKGKGEDAVKAARGVGVGGAIIHSARGVGIRERMGLLSIAVDAERDVVDMLVGSHQAEMVANTIYAAVDLGRPGGGIVYMTPLEAAAIYLPQEIRDRLEEQST